ncbi:hypothetical protein K469DRAFT_689000 [Zopfia rhizophila CBS 207.26]|uniref:Uncharacterized protein n=1 Tax=Zopfia rhizophila CBS 207.26 TaxID=1314779 RepID=A0A6A6EVK9_9PEZI|nr:hypothetical protein K469DRAFT_689000 [Zopfia rhizophila CBS 207.26]
MGELTPLSPTKSSTSEGKASTMYPGRVRGHTSISDSPDEVLPEVLCFVQPFDRVATGFLYAYVHYVKFPHFLLTVLERPNLAVLGKELGFGPCRLNRTVVLPREDIDRFVKRVRSQDLKRDDEDRWNPEGGQNAEYWAVAFPYAHDAIGSLKPPTFHGLKQVLIREIGYNESHFPPFSRIPSLHYLHMVGAEEENARSDWQWDPTV